MNSNSSYSDYVRILNDLDDIPYVEYSVYINQYEEGEFIFGRNFFLDSHYHLRYVKSLFESGYYQKVIIECPEALVYLLNHNEWERSAKLNYKMLLFKLSASYCQIGDFQNAKVYCDQLAKLDYNKKEVKYLKSTIRRLKTKDFLSFFETKQFYYGLLVILVATMGVLLYQLIAH